MLSLTHKLMQPGDPTMQNSIFLLYLPSSTGQFICCMFRPQFLSHLLEMVLCLQNLNLGSCSHLLVYLLHHGLPMWLRGKEFVSQCRGCRRHRFASWIRKIPRRKKWLCTEVSLRGKFHGQKSLTGSMRSQRVRHGWATERAHTHAPSEQFSHCIITVYLFICICSNLDCKEIQPVYPQRDQSWVFIGRTDAEDETPVLWPPHVKSWLIGKDPDAGREWGQEEKGMTEDEMAGWHHQLDGHEFE